MLNDMDLRVDGGWRNSSNWGGEKDRESLVSMLCGVALTFCPAREDAIALE